MVQWSGVFGALAENPSSEGPVMTPLGALAPSGGFRGYLHLQAHIVPLHIYKY